MKQAIIEEVTIYPVHNRNFISSEHPQGELQYIGDAIGRDCVIVKFVDGWSRMYKGDGGSNEDWYGWLADVLAPCDSIVEAIHVNLVTNKPGNHQNKQASTITFLGDDGVRVSYAHVVEILVRQGDTVKAGDLVAKVGNNGTSWHPHIHIGAWKEKSPLQIRFDLQALGNIRKENKERYYCRDL